MVVDPAASALMTPELFTVAILLAAVVQSPPASPLELKVVVPFTQTLCVPESVPAFGAVVTVMVTTFEFAAVQAPFVTTAL